MAEASPGSASKETFRKADYRRHLLAGFFICLAFFAPRLASDGALYHEILRSLAIDGDLNLANEREFYTWYFVPVFPFYGVGHGFRDTGYPRIPFNVGSPLVELPGFCVGHLVSLVAEAAGYVVSANGYSFAERLGAALTSFPLAVVGLFLTWRLVILVSREPPQSRPETKLLLAAAAITLLASPLPAFVLVTPTFSHAASYALSSAFLLLAVNWLGESRSGKQDVLLGLLLGAAALVRTQCLFLGAFLLVEPFIPRLHEAASPFRTALWSYMRIGAAAFVAFSPQLAFNTVVFGTPFLDPQGEGGMHWLHPRLDLFLFDGTRGLLVTSPLLVVAMGGLLPLWKRKRAVFSGLLLTILIQFYLDSARRDWAGVGFGVRRVILLVPVFTVGLWEIFRMVRRKPRLLAVVISLSGMAVLWNLTLMAQYYLTAISAPGSEVGALNLLKVNIQEGPKLVAFLMAKGLLGSFFSALSMQSFLRLALFVAALMAATALVTAAGRIVPILSALLPIVILAAVAGFLTIDAYMLQMLFSTRDLQAADISPPPQERPRLRFRHLVLRRGVPYEGVRGGFLLGPDRSGYEVRKATYSPGFLTPGQLEESFHPMPPRFRIDVGGKAAAGLELVIGLSGELKPDGKFLSIDFEPGRSVRLSRDKRSIQADVDEIQVTSRLLPRRPTSPGERAMALVLTFPESRLLERVTMERLPDAPPLAIRGFALRIP